jgi:hypothetical protein
MTIQEYYNFDSINLSYTDVMLQKEWQSIKNSNYGYESGNSWNKLIKQFQFKEFYKEEIRQWKENRLYKGLPLKSWLYLNRKKYTNKGYGELTQEEIMRGFKISGIYFGNSFHSPFYIKQFIKDYNIKTIYDPCGGWGHRMLGAKSNDTYYIYNDINSITKENCEELSKYLEFNNIEFYSNDCSTFQPITNYEAIFTCPPYHSTEYYSNEGAENLSYKDFLTWWDKTIKISCVQKESCKLFAFVINHVYKEPMKQICLDNGLVLEKEIVLGISSCYSHFNHVANKVVKNEQLLIFKKAT